MAISFTWRINYKYNKKRGRFHIENDPADTFK